MLAPTSQTNLAGFPALVAGPHSFLSKAAQCPHTKPPKEKAVANAGGRLSAPGQQEPRLSCERDCRAAGDREGHLGHEVLPHKAQQVCVDAEPCYLRLGAIAPPCIENACVCFWCWPHRTHPPAAGPTSPSFTFQPQYERKGPAQKPFSPCIGNAGLSNVSLRFTYLTDDRSLSPNWLSTAREAVRVGSDRRRHPSSYDTACCPSSLHQRGQGASAPSRREAGANKVGMCTGRHHETNTSRHAESATSQLPSRPAGGTACHLLRVATPPRSSSAKDDQFSQLCASWCSRSSARSGLP